MAVFGGGDEFRTYGVRVEVQNLDALDKLREAQQSITRDIVRDTAAFEAKNLTTEQYVQGMGRLANQLAATERSIRTLKQETDSGAAALERFNQAAASEEGRLAALAAKVDELTAAQRRREAASINAAIRSETAANLEAAQSIDKFNAELGEEEMRLKRARQALDEFHAAENRLNDARIRGASQADQVGKQNSAMGQGFRTLGYQVYFAAQAIEDLQYGFAAILNNIPLMVMSMGGSAGLAGAISIVGVGINTLVRNWETVKREFGTDTFRPARQSLESLKDDLKGMTGTPWKIDLDYMLIDEANQKIKELEERLQKYEGTRMSAEQRELSRRATEAVTETVGSAGLRGILLDPNAPFRREFESNEVKARQQGMRENIARLEKEVAFAQQSGQDATGSFLALAGARSNLAKSLDDEKKRIDQAARAEVGAFEMGEIPAINRMRARTRGAGGDLFGQDFKNFLSAVSRESIREDRATDSADEQQEAGNQRARQARQRRTERQREKAQEMTAGGSSAAEVRAALGAAVEYDVDRDLRRQEAAEKARETRDAAAAVLAGENVMGRDRAAADRDRARAAARAATKETREAHAEDVAGRTGATPYMPAARAAFGAQARIAANANIGEVEFGRQIGEGLQRQLSGRADIPPDLVDNVAKAIIHNLYTEAMTRMIGNMARGIAGGGGGTAAGGPRSPVAASAPGQAVVARGSGSGPATVTVGGSLPGTVGGVGMGGMGGMGGVGLTQMPIMAGMGGFGGMGGMGGISHHAGMGFGGGFGGQHHRMGMMGAMMGVPSAPGIAHPFGAFAAPGMPMMEAPDLMGGPGIIGPGDLGVGGLDPLTASFMAGLGGPMVPGRAQVAGAGRSVGGMGAGLLGGLLGGVVPQRRGRRAGAGGGAVGAVAATRGRPRKAKVLAVGPRASAKGGRRFGEGGLFSGSGAGAYARGGSAGVAGAAIQALARTQDATVGVTAAVADMLRSIMNRANQNGARVGQVHSWLQSMAQSQPTRQDEG